MQALLLALALAVMPAAAQETKKAPPKTQKKMPVAKGHSKPTPEQIRKFNELEKKQGK
jgi:hypothetical protein